MPKLGHVTPSRFSDIMTGGRKGEQFGLVAQKYAKEVALGSLGVSMPEVKVWTMERGKILEPQAIERYEMETFCLVHRPTESIHHYLPIFAPFVCGRPDGLIGDDGVLEVKCPENPIFHTDNVTEAAQYHSDYKAQVQGYLWITGRQYCDFVSFHPGFPNHLQIGIHQIARDDEYIEKLAERVVEFLKLVKEQVEILTNFKR